MPLVTATYGQALQITYKCTYTSVTLGPRAEKPHFRLLLICITLLLLLLCC